MPDEITANVRLKVGGVLSEDFNPGRIQVDQTNQNKVELIDSIGTSEETISLSTLTAPGAFVFQNYDTTNYVEVGISTGVYSWKLLASDFPAIGRLPASVSNIYIKANTAACRCKVVVYDT
jgi:hypothetical protein